MGELEAKAKAGEQFPFRCGQPRRNQSGDTEAEADPQTSKTGQPRKSRPSGRSSKAAKEEQADAAAAGKI